MFTFTVIHVVLSLAAIGSGFVVLYGMLNSELMSRWTAFFLATTVLTTVTGFGFPAQKVTPAHVLGLISLVVLSVAIHARYSRHLDGFWQTVYVVNALTALYLNVFVLIAQAFLKIPVFTVLAPTQSEAPFAISQLVALVGFVVVGRLAVSRFQRTTVSLA